MNARDTSSSNVSSALRRILLPMLPPAPIPESSFLGDDEDGVALEVMAIELEDESLLVIHAMLLRDRYQEQYEEAKKWRR